jgi:hypothetical protein
VLDHHHHHQQYSLLQQFDDDYVDDDVDDVLQSELQVDLDHKHHLDVDFHVQNYQHHQIVVAD